MAESTNQQLKWALQLVKAKKRAEALKILLPILQEDSENLNAWWLLANSVNDPNDAREALENVLSLKPDHAGALKMLDKLNAHFPASDPGIEPEPDFLSFESDPFAEADALFDEHGDNLTLPAAVASQPAPSQLTADEFFYGTAEAPPAEETAPVAATERSARTQPAAAQVEPMGAPMEEAPRRRRERRRRTSPLVWLLAFVGAVTICACLACSAALFALPAVGFTTFRGPVVEVVGGVSDLANADFSNSKPEDIIATVLALVSAPDDGSRLPAAAVIQGGIERGQARQEFLGEGELHGWTFVGSAGERIVIDALGTEAENPLDTLIWLYAPDRSLVATDDDSGEMNYDARLEVRLPVDGTYTIVVQSYAGAGGGNYELQLAGD